MAGFALLIAAGSSCAPRDGRLDARGADAVSLAVRSDVLGFSPTTIGHETWTLQVYLQIVEGLVRLDGDFRLQPGLARRWQTPDDRTYVMELEPGLRFSDGRLMTAQDAVASLLAARGADWANSQYLHPIESVRAIGETRIEIRTSSPYPRLLNRLAWGFVLPAAALDSKPILPLGTGPYALESWQKGRGFVLRRNPKFRGPAPAFERGRFRIVPDARERVRLLLAGEVDVSDQIPLDAIAELKGRGLQVFHGPGARVMLLGLRVDRAPFSDRKVREAVALAIDRQELIERALDGFGEPAFQPVPPLVLGHVPEAPEPRPDRSRARRLLAEAGHPGGFELQLDGTLNRYVNDRRILDELARQLGTVGIRVKVNALEKGDFFRLVQAGGSDAHLIGWACESGDAGDILELTLHSPLGGLSGTGNTMGLKDAELDRMIDRVNGSADLQQRMKALNAALSRVAELRPVVPLVVQPEAVAISRRIAWRAPLNYSLRLSEMAPAH